MKTTKLRLLSMIFVAVFLLTSLAACSAKANGGAAADLHDRYDSVAESATGADNNYAPETEMKGEYVTGAVGGNAVEDGSSSSTGSAEKNTAEIANPEKLVYRANVSIETKTFDEAVEALRAQVAALGGIVQSEEYSDDMPSDYYYGDKSYYRVSGYKRFKTTVRIPTPSFQSFLDSASTIGHLRSSSSYVENITQSYYSSKAYLDSYNAQLDVLQGMYAKAATIEEMIHIESRIAEVQAHINQLTTKIQSMDRDVAYSTILVVIDEVEVYSDTPREEVKMTFGQNIKSHFASSWRDFVDGLQEFVLWLIDSMWGILVLLVIAAVIVLLVRLRIARNRKKRALAARPRATAVPVKEENPTQKS